MRKYRAVLAQGLDILKYGEVFVSLQTKKIYMGDILRTLFRQIGRYRWAVVATPLLTALETAVDVMIPYETAKLIDRGLSAGSMPAVWHYGGVMLLLGLLSLVLGVAAGWTSAYASTGFASNLRRAMYRRIQQYSFANIDRFSTPGLVTRLTTDVQSLQGALQQLMRVSVRAPFRLVLSVVMCWVIHPSLSVIFLVALLVLSLFLYLIISRVSRLFRQVYERYDALNQSVQENVRAIRVVKAFVREEHEKDKFERAAEGLYRLYVKAESLMALNHPVMNLVMYGCIIALSWWGAHFVVGGTLTTGQLTSLFTYIMSILQALMMLSMIFVMLTQSAASAQRVSEVLQEEPDIKNPAQPRMEVADGSLEFRHVRFDYGQQTADSGQRTSKRSALYDVSFSVSPGETIGIIGGTGSGKSTLVSLINRLYDPREGQVLVGGSDVREYDLKALRSAVSVVLQQNTLFSGSVLDNLRWGRPDATLEECREACRLAQADEFISEMPQGYETRIEQGGVNVSGGQKQRICIARALLKRPRILVLDDSTSACDTTTDARIQRAFREELPRMTKLIIAQRISSVAQCDRILVMDNGMVTGFDTHERLLQTNELYREICELQNADRGDFDQKGGDGV